MKIKFTWLFFLFFIVLKSYPQETENDFSVLFYNAENLFDPQNDPETDDDEFTQAEDRYWSYKRLNQKLRNISKVILNASGWSTPAIIGLCEIENRNVLEQLIQDTPLQKLPLKIIHKESPDHRGTDVALLYNSDLIYPINYAFYPLVKNNKILKTREILYFNGIVNKQDTVHIFVNHWPSRYEGLLETKSDRELAGILLKSKVAELNRNFQNPKIIIIGDFNDQPTDESVLKVLGAIKYGSKAESSTLYNLSANWFKKYPGTIKYQSQWFFFDQIIVSGNWLSGSAGFYITPENATIINSSFLLEKDEKYGGVKPFRTYIGFSYNGGFSDHLPVKLLLKSRD